MVQNWLSKRNLPIKYDITSWDDYNSKIKENMDVPPAEIQSSNYLSKEFINYIKAVENGSKVGFKNGRWYPHNSPEGGTQTIGYGHKLSARGSNYSNGLTDREVEQLLLYDLENAKQIMYHDIKSMFDVNIKLDSNQEAMLLDFAFNLGTLKKFPNFTKAVLNKDWDTVKKEYKRSFKDSSGNRHELGRNKIFFDTFLKNLK